ncbi:MAG: HEPN domain-containing protein, partial [Candidatus Aminicenantes bacterium]|nr:HEPN domain-containing protein [Candidatus Aminicenantes bacterium]
AFLAHQAVEKLLKSVFALIGKKIPRTHYIDELAGDLNLHPAIMDEVLDLVGDYTFSRYPDVSEHTPYEEYNEVIAREKVERAKKVFYEVMTKYKELAELK